MAQAVVVQDVYKKFGKPGEPFWKRMLKRGMPAHKNGNGNGNGNGRNGQTGNGGNGNGGAEASKNGSKNGKARIVVAVDHISFEVQEGEIFGVLGPNGGGKSTLIRLISTLLIPDSGLINVFGNDVVRQPMRVQEMINRVSVEASFFKKLSAAGEPDVRRKALRAGGQRNHANRSLKF